MLAPAEYGTDFSRQLMDRYLLITGSTQGLGEATARLFIERGAAGIALIGRNTERGQALAKSLSTAQCKVIFVQADLTKREQASECVTDTIATFGQLHGVVHCAGCTDRGSILDTDPETYTRLFAVNAEAPFFMMQTAVRHMVEHKIEGTILNICTMSSHGGQSFLTAYSASKAALVAMTKNVAFSLMRNKIRANVLNIGWMDSPGEHAIQANFHHAPSDWLNAVEAREPNGRLIKPEEVARAAAFLSSQESGLMTGAVIDFDQGVLGCGDGRTPQPDKAMTWPLC
ncbi:SDR family oxidoreductase [uncultured Thiothrix sp.]|uniref:SDR family oxidoreductase n=1 Tax=uncultured Thiothrix sp. TaxID=223185 RepID=UPI002622685C|nr:SDR family oxidoreductase [uncultured Thiothrix sp.]